MAQDALSVVQEVYGAFGRGDIPTLLGYMTDDIHWEPVIGTSTQMPSGRFVISPVLRTLP